MPEMPTESELARMPIFPLPQLVLFPHTQLPLHFFEPRYRALITDCIEHGPRYIVVAQVQPGEHPKGKVPIYTRAGLGRIVEHRRNTDGTHDVVLEGIARVNLDEIETDEPYRRARATVLASRAPAGGVDPTELRALVAVAQGIAGLLVRAGRSFELKLDAEAAPEVVIDQLADQLVVEAAARQEMLETLDLQRRLGGLLRLVVQLEARVRASLDGEIAPPN